MLHALPYKLRKCFLLLFFIPVIAHASKKDSLLHLLSSRGPDSTKVKAAYLLAKLYLKTNPDSALHFCKVAEGFINAQTPLKFKSQVFLSYANVYTIAKGDFAKASVYALEGLKYALQSKDINTCGEAYLCCGAVYGAVGEYEKAVKYFMKSEKYYQESNDLKGLARLYNDIGILYYNQQNYNDAIRFYKKSLVIKKKRGKPEDLAHAYQNLSGVFYNLAQYDSSLYYLDQALNISIDIKDKVGQAQAYDGKSIVFRELHRINESLAASSTCLKLATEIGDKWMVGHAHHALAEIYEERKDYQKAISNFMLCVNIDEQIVARHELSEDYRGLARVYSKMGNYKKAYEYFYEYAGLKDSLSGESVKKNVQEIEAKYQSEKKEKEIALLNRAKTEDSLKIALQGMLVKDKDLQIEKRRGQVKYLAAIAIILAVFGIWIVYALRNKHKANLIIQQQKKDVEFQKHLVDEKQKEIIDSINYAKRIQNTLLASHKFIDENIGESFIFFKPKDIVSGDFYWAATAVSDSSFLVSDVSNKKHFEATLQNEETRNQELFYISVCDSTGHGVPGAFMSLLNIGFLNESIKERGIHEPHKVFDNVRRRLIESISSEGQRDGFDGMLLCIDKSSKQVFYAAANNPPLLISGGVIKNLPYDKMHVGKGVSEDDFKLYSFSYSPGDMVYMFTDGYPDQFGGPKGKKFKYKQLEQLIFQNHHDPLETQKAKLDSTFSNWKGDLEQVDDVCIIGIKL